MTVASESLEREVKLEAEPDFTLPDLRDLVPRTSRLPEKSLWATYFDSADLRLWNRGITLRHRLESDSDVGVWTLKLPERASGQALERTELTWRGRVDDLPVDVVRITRGVMRRQPFQQLVEIESHRRRLTLHRDGGRILGELDDDRATVHGGAMDGLQFREIELELDDPDLDLLEAVLTRLQSAGARLNSGGPKLGRALGISKATARESRTIRLRRKSSMADVVRHSAQRGLNSVLDHDYRVRVRPQSPAPADIHRSRVAARRLRSDLKTLRPVLDPMWVKHTRADLKWLGAALGDVRDVDVLQSYLTDSRTSGRADEDGTAILSSELRYRRSLACHALVVVLESDRYLTLLDKLHAAALTPPVLDGAAHGAHGVAPGDLARRHLPVLVDGAWAKLRKETRQVRGAPTDRQLHRVRIRAKQVRYAAELSVPVVGRPARRTAKLAESVQEELGHHQDAVMADQWLRSHIGQRPAEAEFAAGQLSADQLARRRRARHRWIRLRKRLRRAKVHRWMD